MTRESLMQTQQSIRAATVPGHWRLSPGRAITLRPRETGVLRVASGQLWITFDGAQRGLRHDLGDHFVRAGEQLALRAGQRLVMEAFDVRRPAHFAWDPLPLTAVEPRLTQLAQPLRDLRAAWTLGAGAAAQLAAALAALAWNQVIPRGREAPDCDPCPGGTCGAGA
jgi:hypothetical protein